MDDVDIFAGQFAFDDPRGHSCGYKQEVVWGPERLRAIDRIRPTRIIAYIHNDGQHIWRGKKLPRDHELFGRPLIPLPYREFCGSGKYLKKSQAHFQHLGHLYGVHGGTARVVVTGKQGPHWNLELPPHSSALILEYAFGFAQVLFVKNNYFVPNQRYIFRH